MPVMVADQDQDARRQHDGALGIAQHPLPPHAGLGDHQRGQAFEDQQRREEIQREIDGIIERVDEQRDACNEKQAADDIQPAGALAQVVHAQQQQNQIGHCA